MAPPVECIKYVIIVAAESQSQSRDFQSVRRELEAVVAELKTSHDPQTRKNLLRELRLLLEKADRLIASEISGEVTNCPDDHGTV